MGASRRLFRRRSVPSGFLPVGWTRRSGHEGQLSGLASFDRSNVAATSRATRARAREDNLALERRSPLLKSWSRYLPASNSHRSSDSAISSYSMKARALYGRRRVKFLPMTSTATPVSAATEQQHDHNDNQNQFHGNSPLMAMALFAACQSIQQRLQSIVPDQRSTPQLALRECEQFRSVFS